MSIILYLIFVVFIILGIMFLCGKGSFLIAGYNTATQEEKDKVNEKQLCRFMGKLMIVLALCWLFITFGEVFKNNILLWFGIVTFISVAIGGIIYINTNGKFKK